MKHLIVYIYNKFARMSYYVFLLSLGVSLAIMPQYALSATSSNYSIQEDFFGSGGVIDSSSTNYQSQDSIGGVGVGDGASSGVPTSGTQTQSGYTTTNDPSLDFIVTGSNANLGALSSSVAKTATGSFSVLNYTSSGYIVQIIGDTPSNGSHNLTNMASAAASSVGTEQFGINLVANTSPTTFGADPVQQPSTAFSYGAAATGYNTTNLYKYVNGQTIATASRASGKTDYTISYLANISIATPNGSYSSNQVLVCVGNY